MRILVIKFRNIGDVLLTTPLISALKRAGHEVTFLVKEGTELILEGHPDINTLLTYPARLNHQNSLRYRRREWQFLQNLQARKFDLAINTTEGDRGIITAKLAGSRKIRGIYRENRNPRFHKWLLTDPRVPSTARRHTILRNLDLGLPDIDPGPIHVSIPISAEDDLKIARLLSKNGYMHNQPLVHIHPTSRWFFKCWTDSGMALTIDRLQQAGIQVAMTCAPDQHERDRLDQILRSCQTTPIDLGGQLTLKETAALSKKADAFLGVDTAPMHMAAAVNTPVIALFGPTGAFDWGPWPNGWDSQSNPYPQRNGLQKVGLHTVIQANWNCSPCGQDGCGGSKRSICLEELSVNMVLEQINQTLHNKQIAYAHTAH